MNIERKDHAIIRCNGHEPTTCSVVMYWKIYCITEYTIVNVLEVCLAEQSMCFETILINNVI